jgi:hypothetical protein
MTMAIDPLKTGTASPLDAARLGQTAANKGAQGAAPAKGAGTGATGGTPTGPRDSLELSADYKALAARSADAAGAAGAAGDAGLSPERMREVLDRMKSGFYDSAHVRDQIAGRIQQDLGL